MKAGLEDDIYSPLRRGLDALTLKIIALVLMTADHIYWFLPNVPVALHMLGRLSAPLFFFAAANSLAHTSHRAKYALRLYLASLLMGLLRAVFTAVYPPSGGVDNNIFATLLYVVYFVEVTEILNKRILTDKRKKRLLPIALMVLPFLWSLIIQVAFMGTDIMVRVGSVLKVIIPSVTDVEGGTPFVILGVAFYFFKGSKWALSVFYTGFSAVMFVLAVRLGGLADAFSGNVQWMMILALPLMLLYNQKRGRPVKWLFYIYYPAHIWLLFFAGQLLM